MVAILFSPRLWLLALPLFAAALGCATRAPKCNRCGCGHRCCLSTVACGVYHGTLADEVMCCGTGCLDQAGDPCSCPPSARCGPDCSHCRECRLIPFGLARPLCEKPQPGPPPVRFRPEMPPNFLPVPTAPTVSPVRAGAPEPNGGDIEVSYSQQLISPGGD